MDIRYNINRIHSNLKEYFEDMTIVEKSSLRYGNYFELIVEAQEGMVKMVIPFKNLDNKSQIEWTYFSNPTNESSTMVPRTSTNDSILSDVIDIIKNKRFSQEYLNN